MITNFKSVAVRGAFNCSRARVLWYDGLLRIFDVNGLVLETKAEKPQKKPRFLRTWNVKTAKGDLTMTGKCMTCGGKQWRRVTFMSSQELWDTAP